MNAQEEAVRMVVDAFENEGVNPVYHRKIKADLAINWPTLYYAINALTIVHRNDGDYG